MTQTHDRPSSPFGDSPTEGPLGMLARSAWQFMLFAGIATLIIGVLVLAWPDETLVAIGVLFGLYLLFSGVMQLIAAFGTHTTTALRVMAFISGALSILLGLFCFRGATQSIFLLALWIGIGWLFRGIMETVAAISDPAMPARGWHIFLGVVTFLAGVVLIASPLESLSVLTVLGGCWALVVGVVEIVTALMIRSGAKDLPTGT
ncbi:MULTISPECIES: HdeD family acid-resistance protein [Streptomyces]|uniref:HdeD family acid-resistance protein n=1 Tax=Streptomyces solicathayae TaxID=3081768 RepID=A0ABZ0LMV5_9ACTN|nr:HdeD family acid-resistance protein [Streptomyces sp. HUAS YS2]WOX20823.1 HdeD family acid-resistance protein [Streptomyces sp. HUAS YS2]